jgi:hypothetical protein
MSSILRGGGRIRPEYTPMGILVLLDEVGNGGSEHEETVDEVAGRL